MQITTCATCGKLLEVPIEAEAHEQIHHRSCFTDDVSVYFEDENGVENERD